MHGASTLHQLGSLFLIPALELVINYSERGDIMFLSLDTFTPVWPTCSNLSIGT